MDDQKSFLTDEQRKGLIYGSMISAILSGGAAMRSGGNITDAIGRGTMGAAQAFGGGLESIAKIKHEEIENAKNEEAVRASQEAQSLSKKRLGMEETAHKATMEHVGAQTSALQEASAARTDKMRRLSEYLAAQAPGSPEGGPPSAGGIDLGLLKLGGPENMDSAINAYIKSTTTSDTFFDPYSGNTVRVNRATQPPPGVVTPSQANTATRTQSAEDIAKEHRDSEAVLAAAGLKVKKDIATQANQTRKDLAEAHGGEKAKYESYYNPKTNSYKDIQIPATEKQTEGLIKASDVKSVKQAKRRFEANPPVPEKAPVSGKKPLSKF